jgi:hypothetical protein
LRTGAGAADAFAVSAALAAAPEARFRFCLIVEDPAAVIVAAAFNARRLTTRNSLYERVRDFSKDPLPASRGWNKLELQPILALERLPFAT